MNELEKRAEHHKKRQRGLALSYLNTDAGNVEYNVAMFNKMNSPIDTPINNPISGPFGGDVNAPAGEGTAMGEGLENSNIESLIDLEYENISVTVYGEQRDADDWDEWEVTTDWTYKVDKNDIEVLIIENYLSDEDLPNWDDLSDEEVDKFVSEHFDSLFEKYQEQIKDHYYEDACEDAQERYEYEPDYPEYDPYDEEDLWEELHKPIRKNSVLDEGMADDDFDIFLRTI